MRTPLLLLTLLLAAPVRAQTTATDAPLPPVAALRILGTHSAAVHLDTIARAHQATVLVFVGAKCGVTWLYADKIAAFAAHYAARGVAVLLVHTNADETDAEIRAATAAHGLGKLPLLDDKPQEQLARAFGATVTPLFVVLDKRGALRYQGAWDEMGGSVSDAKRIQYVLPAVAALLAGKNVAVRKTRALGCDLARQ